MSIRRTPEGRYYYRFQYDHRDYCQGGFYTKKQAQDAETVARHKAINGGIKPHQVAGTMTFLELAEKYLKESPPKRSMRNDKDRLRVIAPFFRKTPLNHLTAQDIRSVLDDLQHKRKFSDHTWNHYHAAVRKVINWIKGQDLFAGDNPAEKIAQRPVERARVRFLYPAEQKLVTEMVRQDREVWPHFWLALRTGMRASELAWLRVKNVSFVTDTIFVERAKSYRSRYVPIPEDCRELLIQWLAGKGPEQYALSGFTPTWISARYKRLADLAGVRDAHFHDLRHTYAYNRLTNGVDIYTVSKLLGHSSVKVTQDHYGHLAMADLHKATNQTTRLEAAGEASTRCNGVAMADLPPLGLPRGV